MEMTQRFIDVRGMRIHYWTTGEETDASRARPTIILLHGGGIDSAELSWGLLMPELAAQARLAGNMQVIAPDFPGYGESDHPEMAYSVNFYVDFLIEFLDAMNIRHASFAGLSMGGAVALGFALRCPERVEKLVLVDSYGLQQKAAFHKLSYLLIKTPGMNEASWWMMRSRGMVRYTLKALLNRPGSITPELVEQVYRDANRPGAGKAWNAFQKDEMQWNGARTCYMDRLAEIKAPTLIIHGSKDSAVPPQCATQAHERIPGSRLHWLEGCGHWAQRDNPQEFNRVIREFLTS